MNRTLYRLHLHCVRDVILIVVSGRISKYLYVRQATTRMSTPSLQQQKKRMLYDQSIKSALNNKICAVEIRDLYSRRESELPDYSLLSSRIIELSLPGNDIEPFLE